MGKRSPFLLVFDVRSASMRMYSGVSAGTETKVPGVTGVTAAGTTSVTSAEPANSRIRIALANMRRSIRAALPQLPHGTVEPFERQREHAPADDFARDADGRS